MIVGRRARWLVFVSLVAALAACKPEPSKPTSPGGAIACSADALPACEDRIANALALGDDLGPLVGSYASARKEKDPKDAFAAALDAAKAHTKDRTAVAIVAGAADPTVAKDLPRFAIGAVVSMGGKVPSEVLYAALADASGLDLLAVVRPDGSVVRAFGRDPLAPFMSGLAPVVVDRDARMLEHDGAIERELRASVTDAGAFDYVGASDHIDAVEAALEAEDPYDAEALRARVVLNALGMSAPEPLLGMTTEPTKPPEPAPAAHETPYYDLLRVRLDRSSAKAYERRQERMLAGAPAEMRPFIQRIWGTPSGCAVTLPPSFERPRDLGFAYLLPIAILPAGARDQRGRLSLADWYPRYEKLVDLVERTHTAYYAAMFLVSERGGASSITPTGTNTHRRVDALALKHARALEELAKKKPGRVGLSQLGFIASPAAYSDEGVRRALHDVARVAAQGLLAQAKDAWDVLAGTLTGALLSSNMPPEVRQEHVAALAGAFAAKLSGDLRTQTGWGAALAYGVDLAYRSFSGLAPDPKTSVTQIARALESDPKIAQPGLAALASAVVRYAALAGDDSLGNPFLEEGESTLPVRSAARASLARAIEQLSDSGKPDPRAVADLAALADNAAATFAFAMVAKKPEAKRSKAVERPNKQGKVACDADADAPLDLRIGRALSKLREQRRKVLGAKALAHGTDAWSKRARLFALLLSDGIDLSSAKTASPKKPPKKDRSATADTELTKFFVPFADSETILKEALASFGADGDIVSASKGAYGLVRGFFGRGASYLEHDGRADGRDLLSAIGKLVSDPGQPSATGGLLDGLASALGSGSTGPAFVEVARGVYDKGNGQQADMILLAAVVASALTESPLAPEAFDLAVEKKSQTAWLFDFLRFARPAAKGAATPQPPRFKPGLDALLTDKCAMASTTTIADVLDAVERFKRGERDRARADLDAALERGAKDLTLPHVAFTFKQETRTRALNLAIDFGLAAPFVSSTGGVNVGGGFKSPGDPKLELSVDVDSADAKRARDDTARYFVHASATAAIYHFLSGDPQKAERAAARTLGALVQRTWLYAPGVTDEPIRFADGAYATLAILAQQAIDSGRPLLAGSLLQVIRSSFDPAKTRSSDILALLDTLPKPLQGISDLDPVVARTKKTLAYLGAGMACIGPKLDKAALLNPSCEAYPLSLALRVADSLAAMPTLASGKRDAGRGCTELAAVEGFLVPAQSGKYDPDKFLEAVDRLLEQNKAFDAAFLLTRPRDPGQCSERVVEQLRKTADRLEGVATFRADLLTAVVNCEVGANASVLSADLAALDRELDAVGDPSRQIQIGFFSAALAQRRGEPALADTIVKKKDFLSRHRKNGPLLSIALLLDHLASSLAGHSPDVDGTQRDMDFLCGLGDLPAGPDTCKMLKSLRQEGVDGATRKRVAEDILLKLSPK